jgi:MFS family permease
MDALIVGRVIAGIGGGGMYLGNLNLITLNTSLRERSVYMGGIGIVWGAGTIFGVRLFSYQFAVSFCGSSEPRSCFGSWHDSFVLVSWELGSSAP